MREIKFRAWDTEHKQMVDDVYALSFYKSLNDCLKNSNIMQFTGIQDKNGKEIYEGDIIKYKKQHSLVQWISDGFKIVKVLSPTRTRTSTLGYFISEYQCEVVGNIYENPELLK